MTEKECLQKMDDIWFYLFRNPSKSKKEAYGELGLKRDKNRCPCCEYAIQQADSDKDMMCVFCPLKDSWPDGDCMADGSVYLKWLETDNLKVREDAAAEIACDANFKFFELIEK